MNKRLTNKERVNYIRKGNELFNKGKFKEAETVFMLTNYRDGIKRIADRYCYELKQPLYAIKYYKKINAQENINEIKERMLFAIKKLISPEYNNDSENFNKNDNTHEVEDNIKQNINKNKLLTNNKQLYTPYENNNYDDDIIGEDDK